MAVLFSQQSPVELDQALHGLRTVADRDYRLIRSYQRNVAAYRDQRSKLKRQVEKLVTLERKIREQEGRLVAEHQAKAAVVSGLEASKAAQIERMQAIRADAPAIPGADEKLVSLLQASFFERKGRLPPPVAGTVTRGYGAILDERSGAQLSHRGWQIAAARGAPIAAVFDGSIAFSGWMDGYGSLIVVDHGDHYYTIYGNSAKPRFKPGDSVKLGQTIAEVGDSSWRSGKGIYFEIRHFSEPEDPARWVRANGAPSLARALK